MSKKKGKVSSFGPVAAAAVDSSKKKTRKKFTQPQRYELIKKMKLERTKMLKEFFIFACFFESKQNFSAGSICCSFA